MTNTLELRTGCLCAGGVCCGGHLVLNGGRLDFTPIGYQGAAQHTYTRACDGFHETGPCPDRAQVAVMRPVNEDEDVWCSE